MDLSRHSKQLLVASLISIVVLNTMTPVRGSERRVELETNEVIDSDNDEISWHQCIVRSMLMNTIMPMLASDTGGSYQPEELMPLEKLTKQLKSAALDARELEDNDTRIDQGRIVEEAETLARLSDVTGPDFAISIFLRQLVNCQRKYL